jgi:dolichol kinase
MIGLSGREFNLPGWIEEPSLRRRTRVRWDGEARFQRKAAPADTLRRGFDRSAMNEQVTAVIVVVLWMAGLAGLGRLASGLVRGGRVTPFSARKTFHVIAGLSVVPLALWVRPWYLAAIPVTWMLAGNARGNLQRLQGASAGKRAAYLGAGIVLPVLSILILWSRGRADVVALAVLMMSFGDAAAAVAGRWWGRARGLPEGRKTAAGLAAYVAAALAAAAMGAWALGAPRPVPWPAFGAASVAGGGAEALCPGAWDNPVVLLVTLFILSLFRLV